MKRNLIALASGTLFGLGLALGGMVNPAKVLNFLDVAGHWDPSLALVMGAALAVMAVTWRWLYRHPVPLSADIRMKDLSHLDAPLIIGSALFGIGWGLVGFCPGPGISALALLSVKPVIFVISMIAGMGIFQLVSSRQKAGTSEPSGDVCG